MKHNTDDTEEKRNGVYTRRGFIQFVSVGVGVVGASLAGGPFGCPRQAAVAQEEMAASEMVKVRLNINGRKHSVLVEPRWSLLYVLREVLGLSGTKIGCDRGECGACTVLIDDQPRYACLTLAVEAEGNRIVTVEGLMKGEQLGEVQKAFVENDAFQCGYCTSGQIMAVEGLLRNNPRPSNDEVRRGCSGNLCRCGSYNNIFKAAHQAAELKNG